MTTAALDAVALQGQLEYVRQLGRIRQRRIQLPLFLSGAALFVTGAVVAAAARWFALGGVCFALSYWLLLLSVLPTQSMLIALALIVLIGFYLYYLYSSLYSSHCPAGNAPFRCTSVFVLSWFQIVMLGGAILHAVYAVLALAAHSLGASYLARPPRATLDSAWRSYAVVCLGYGATVVVNLAQEVLAPWQAEASSLQGVRGSSMTVAVLATASLALFLVGALSLWPGLRLFVDDTLAARGEGVAAAAGCARAARRRREVRRGCEALAAWSAPGRAPSRARAGVAVAGAGARRARALAAAPRVCAADRPRPPTHTSRRAPPARAAVVRLARSETRIGALLLSCERSELIQRARRSFRAVRLDQLRLSHLDARLPTAEAFKLSTVVPLGSVDVRAPPPRARTRVR